MIKIVSVVGIISSLIIGCKAQKQGATEQARKWSNELGLKPDAISCANIDTDGDGYVSCSLRFGDQIKQIECKGAFSMGSGCREPKVHLNR